MITGLSLPWTKLNGEPGGDPVVVWPSAVSSLPVLIKELIGRKCRVVHPGDKVREDNEAGRVTIFLDADSRIAEIYIETASPQK